jgi:uncharacterized protein (TIGR02118 family)
MSFQVTVLYHQPDDTAAFDRYYDETHIPLVVKIPGLRGYTVSRPGPDENGPAACHLVASLVFDSQEEMAGAMASEEGQAAVADLANFATGGVTMLGGPVQVVV